MLLASCTSTGDPTMSVVTPAYNSTATEMSAASGAKPATSTDSTLQVTSASSEASSTVMSEDDKPLPEKVAYVPETRPGATFPSVAGGDLLGGCFRLVGRLRGLRQRLRRVPGYRGGARWNGDAGEGGAGAGLR
ncbi:hypothetical protein EOA38_27010, partial [Mesorhizobium sp. M1E.F.Ca.ET.041.01.1.1]